jgi:hypothetical protein
MVPSTEPSNFVSGILRQVYSISDGIRGYGRSRISDGNPVLVDIHTDGKRGRMGPL